MQLLLDNPDFKLIEVDLRREPLAIEGIAVDVIRNGKALSVRPAEFSSSLRAGPVTD